MDPQNYEINKNILDYLQYNSYQNSYECFEAEIRTKVVSKKLTKKPKEKPQLQKPRDPPRIYTMMKGDDARTKRETTLEKELKTISKRFLQVLQAGREILSVAVDSCQQLSKFTDVRALLWFNLI